VTRVIQLELDSARLNNGRDFARFVRLALAPIVTLNIIARREGKVPPLYRSGVRFRPEPEFPEKFRDAENVYRTGRGDCAQLAAWCAADHVVSGHAAGIAVIRGKTVVRNGRRIRPFHVVVRRACEECGGLHPEHAPWCRSRRLGPIEDPSLILGGR